MNKEVVVIGGIDPAATTECAVCDHGFTEEEWEDRHSNEDGDDVHEDCCELCEESNESS